MKTLQQIDTFTRAYIECALWSSTDNADESGGEPLDANYSPEDIAPETLQRMISDCETFQADNADALEKSGLDSSRAGHNFWLNRNGHGSGFWDEYSQTTCEGYESILAEGAERWHLRSKLDAGCPCKYHVCQRLSDASKAWGSFDLYVGDDGQLHGS